ncbi:hypothetical protein EMCRGX_G028606 [Ephydatia muelleri]
MATLQKVRITTYFGHPHEVHEDADVTKNRCGKRPDEASGVTLPNKELEVGKCSPSYSGAFADEDEAPTSELLQQSNTKGKQVLNLFGGLLGVDVCKRKGSRSEGRTVSKGIVDSGEAQDHCRPSQKDGHPSALPSCSVDSWSQPSTQERDPLIHQDLTRGVCTDIVMPLADTQAHLGAVAGCTSHRQALLSFDNKGRLVVESSPWQQQSPIPNGASGGTQGPGKGQGGGRDTASTQQQEEVEEDEVVVEMEEDEVVGSAGQCQGQKRRKKGRNGEENGAVMDKEHRKVSNKNLPIIKDQHLSEVREEQVCREVTLMGGEGQKNGMVGSQRKRARKGKEVVDIALGEGSGEEGMKESVRSGDEAIADEVSTIEGNRKAKMKRNVNRSRNVFVNEDIGEQLTHCSASNRSDQTLSKRRFPKERGALADRDVSSRLMLSRKKKHGNRGVEQVDSGVREDGSSTEHRYSREKGKPDVAVEEGKPVVAVEEGAHVSWNDETADKAKRKRNKKMAQPVNDLQVEAQIGTMDVSDEHMTDKTKKQLNEDRVPQWNPLSAGGSVKKKGHHRGNSARHESDRGDHYGNRVRCESDKAEAFLEVTSSSDEERGREKTASDATPLCSSWADIFKKPVALVRKDARSSEMPSRGVGTPLDAGRSGIIKMHTTPVGLRGEEKSRAAHQVSAASSPALLMPSLSPAPCWIRSPYQESPSSPSPLHPPPCGKYTVMTTLDHSPFSHVVHVQQRSPDEPFWHLEPPHSVPMLSHCRNSAPLVPRGSLPRTVIPLCNPVPPSVKVCGALEQQRLLSEMERSDPTSTIRALFARYAALTHTIGEDKASVEVLSTHTGKETSTKKRGHEELVSHKGLVVAIKVLYTRKGNALPRRIVVDGSAYGVRHKKLLRLSKSRRKCGSESAAESLVELPSSCDLTPPPPGLGGCESSSSLYTSSDLWSERYQPVQTSQVLGNTAQVQELYQWMSMWKERATAQRDSLVAGGDVASTRPPCSKPVSAGRVHSDSDDDFVVPRSRRSHASRRCASSDSELENKAEGSDLCPVALLCGPHGSGKTASVLACAQELGFKVFIVDSTTLRSRQNIVSVLREATLSHQVTKQLSTATEQHSAQPTAIVTATKPSRTVANNLLSFFKPQEATTISTASCDSRTKRGKQHKDGRHRRGDKDKCSSEDKPPVPSSVQDTNLPPPQSSEVALVVATVIILEEVDILFEDEKGFWAAIYEIIASTKRPIVMTSNADLCLDCEHMKITFYPPSPDELANHIEALCLAHGTVLGHEEAKQLAIYLGCDTRKVLNTLQYWLAALPREEEVSRAAKDGHAKAVPSGPAEAVACVSVEQLLGLSHQQASLLKRALCPSTQVVSNQVTLSHDAASVLGEALLLVHGGQLGVNVCTNGDAQCNSDKSNTSSKVARLALGNRIKRHAHLASEGVAKSSSHLMSFPWRVQQKTFKWLPHPPDHLDLLSDFLNIMSDVDVLDPWGAPGGVAKPWWVTGVGDARWPHATHTEQSVSSGVSTTMEGLVLAAVATASHDLQSMSCCHDYYGLLRSPDCERHCEAVHTGQMLCCEVFDAQTEMSRRALVVDCLPGLHLLCQSENTRETASTQRRFRHYLQSSTVDIEHLKSFAKTATLHSTPPHTHSIP